MTPLFKKAHAVKYLVVGFLISGISVFLFFFDTAAENNGVAEKQINKSETQTNAIQVSGPLTVNVILQRQYIDGNTSEEVVKETIWSMEDFWAEYYDWQLVDHREGQMIFRKNIDDISPLLKANGYFGITEDGILTIFKGVPEKSEEVIQSFFQIDISKLESRQQEELKKGIPVVSKDHYIQVIDSFKTLGIKQ
ncbi:MAG TPA: regulator [Bacillus bacterium]|nr:regulator [Bacillus sp. (in: firmicutes)]